MFGYSQTIQRLLQQLERELDRVPVRQGGLLSIILLPRELLLRGMPDLDASHFYWARPQDNSYRLGVGECLRIEAAGSSRIEQIERAYLGVAADWLVQDPEKSGLVPEAFCGFAFAADDRMEGSWRAFPNSAIFFPELVVRQEYDRCALILTTNLDPDSQKQEILHRWATRLSNLLPGLQNPVEPAEEKTRLEQRFCSPEKSEWLKKLDLLRQQIGSGPLQKVVPARHIGVRAQRRLSPARLAAMLERLYPSSTLVAVRLDASTFAAATPERLMQRKGALVQCDAIAGTVARAASEEQDRALGARLMHDRKARHEHALVVESIRNQLSILSPDLQVPGEPSLMRLRNLQHLKTEIRAAVGTERGLLEVARRLHPTAAVNGLPTDEAMQWLRRHEPFQRGWYSGAAGWIDARGDGELAVLLRCALLQGDSAELFAGAGVTADSDPHSEWDETQLKLDVMLKALENA